MISQYALFLQETNIEKFSGSFRLEDWAIIVMKQRNGKVSGEGV